MRLKTLVIIIVTSFPARFTPVFHRHIAPRSIYNQEYSFYAKFSPRFSSRYLFIYKTGVLF